MNVKLFAPDYIEALVERIQSLIRSGDIQLLYLNRAGRRPDAAYSRRVACYKRVLECWAADVAFRDLAVADPAAAVASLGMDFDFDLASLNHLWNEQQALATPVEEIPLDALRYRAFIMEKLTHRNQLRATDPTMDARFGRWRERQMSRAQLQLRATTAYSIVHAPFCVELCSGCSVGCWFCGISAPKLSDIFHYNEENAELFNGMMVALKELLGNAAGRGFCYWATDPMDNPGYESFLVDFHKHTGVFPQTTTALGLKDIPRTRALLALSREKGGMLDRFSLLSLGQLRKAFQEFTPEELLYVELVTQNKEGHLAKAKAGRALERTAPGRVDPAAAPGNQVSEGTIACVSGFLISMVSRTIKLISPCVADVRNPLGYLVFDEAKFANADEFRAEIQRMTRDHMGPMLATEARVGFMPFVEYEAQPDGFRLTAPYKTSEFTDDPTLAAVGEALARGGLTVDEIIESLSSTHGADPSVTMYLLNLIANEGYLEIQFPKRSADRLESVLEGAVAA